MSLKFDEAVCGKSLGTFGLHAQPKHNKGSSFTKRPICERPPVMTASPAEQVCERSSATTEFGIHHTASHDGFLSWKLHPLWFTDLCELQPLEQEQYLKL